MPMLMHRGLDTDRRLVDFIASVFRETPAANSTFSYRYFSVVSNTKILYPSLPIKKKELDR